MENQELLACFLSFLKAAGLFASALKSLIEIYLAINHTETIIFVFWPDLASAQYAKDMLARLEELKNEYIPKKENPLIAPQLRPTKNVWAYLKIKVYSNKLSSKRCKVCFSKYRIWL
jgi:hypothetical protein